MIVCRKKNALLRDNIIIVSGENKLKSRFIIQSETITYKESFLITKLEQKTKIPLFQQTKSFKSICEHEQFY